MLTNLKVFRNQKPLCCSWSEADDVRDRRGGSSTPESGRDGE